MKKKTELRSPRITKQGGKARSVSDITPSHGLLSKIGNGGFCSPVPRGQNFQVARQERLIQQKNDFPVELEVPGWSSRTCPSRGTQNKRKKCVEKIDIGRVSHYQRRLEVPSAQSSRRCSFMNKGNSGLRSPKSTFAVLQRPTIERPVDGSWRVLFRCWHRR